MTTATTCPSVRLPLLKALASKSKSSSETSAPGGYTAGAGGAGAGSSSSLPLLRTPEGAAARRLVRWYRRRSATRNSSRQFKSSSSRDDDNRNHRKRSRRSSNDDDDDDGQPPGRKRPKLQRQHQQADIFVQRNSSSQSQQQQQVTLRLLQSSPAAVERRFAAQWLLREAGGSEHATVRLKQELRKLMSEFSNSAAAPQKQQQQRQKNFQYRIVEWMAVWKELLLSSAAAADSPLAAAASQQETGGGGAVGVAGSHAGGNDISVSDNTTSHVVAVCRDDYEFVARQLLHFVATKQTVAASACADWIRHVVLLATISSTESNNESGSNSGNNIDSPDNNDNDNEKKSSNSSSTTPGALTVVQWRNQHWLWRESLDTASTSTTIVDDNQDRGEDSSANSLLRLSSRLSPLACLIASHYAMQDKNDTAGLRGSDALRNLLQLVIDPDRRVVTKKINPNSAKPSPPASTGASNNNNKSSNNKNQKKKSEEEVQNKEEGNGGKRDGDDAPPPLVPHRSRSHHHHRSVLEQTGTGEEDHRMHDGNEDDDDEDLESIDDDDTDDDDDEDHGTPTHVDEDDEEEAEDDNRHQKQQQHQSKDDHGDEYMTDLPQLAAAEDQQEQVVGEGEECGCNDGDDNNDHDEDADEEGHRDGEEDGDDNDDNNEGGIGEECKCECDEDEDDDECEGDEDDEDECDEDEDDEVVDSMEIELSELEQAVADSTATGGGGSSSRDNNKSGSDKDDKNATPLSPPLDQRKRLIIRASMQLLDAHYPLHHHHNHSNYHSNPSSPVTNSQGGGRPNQHHHHSSRRSDLLTLYSESALIEGINTIIKPPKKPVHTKIILRRAPTQEEFFRGSLSRNPITLHQLRQQHSSQQGERAASSSYEPTVDDLRRHIARDLQMEDSAELLEILVANKILAPSLKLRVVHQVVWRNHLMENHPSANSGSSISSLVSHSGLAMIFSSGLSDRIHAGRASITADTPLSQIPAMLATYRLAGVDGEATEDTVSTLIDPEAPLDAATPEEQERFLEAEYGLTKLVTVRDGNKSGIPILLRSIQHSISDTLRRIRRDNVDAAMNGSAGSTVENPSRLAFAKQPPCAGLALLRHCSQLSSNRKLLLRARAPTVLLKLLLDVLKVLEGDSIDGSGSTSSSTRKKNPTAKILQELIEVLSSDISTSDTTAGTDETEEEGYGSDSPQDASSMPLLLESIETISLSPPLRHVIAKLLPFLTYGQSDLSRTLAQHFDRNICVESLGVCEQQQEQQEGNNDQEGDTIMTSPDEKNRVLMNTFVETSISLPPNPVCNTLRVELIHIGFIERLAQFICKDMPKQPPAWSPALWDTATTSPTATNAGNNKKKRPRRGVTNNNNNTIDKAALEEAWRDYFSRKGVRTAFKILTGLCRQHVPTQSRIASTSDFIRCCHWLESTSDNNAANISTTGFGLLAETLLDEMLEGGNCDVIKLIKLAREKTKLRKRELAEERRNQALMKMGSFRPGAASTSTAVATQQGRRQQQQQQSSASSSTSNGVRGAIDAVLGLFSNSPSESPSARASTSRSGKAKDKDNNKPPAKPSWLAELDAMEDDDGLCCAVCQEGRTIQPSELLGLYAYVKKITIPFDQCGSRAGIEGITLLRALPSTMPDTLVGDPVAEEWYLVGKAAADNLPSSSSESLSSSRKNTVLTTTVSAGNAIHFSCHRTARQADRNHPKAPKSEWEGASLRNSRVQCNVILPLVSSRSSKVPLIAVETALTEHQAAISNLLGSTPKSMLWQVLHDVRLLLLRLAYGEALNLDCGGGSLASNCQLVYYQLLMADMFDKDAQVDQPSQSQHARGLSAAFLAACNIVSLQGSSDPPGSLMRGIADAAVMAALNSIVYHNTRDNEGSTSGQLDVPNPKRLWLMGKDFFLRGLLICGGRRHALGLEGSGCQLLSRHQGGHAPRSSALSEWEVVEANDDGTAGRGVLSRSSNRAGSSARRQTKLSIDDFQNALRPMITMYAIMDQISANFTLNMEDTQIEESAERLVRTIEECRQAKNIHQLLEKAKITFDHEYMIDLLQKGMVAA